MFVQNNNRTYIINGPDEYQGDVSIIIIRITHGTASGVSDPHLIIDVLEIKLIACTYLPVIFKSYVHTLDSQTCGFYGELFIHF